MQLSKNFSKAELCCPCPCQALPTPELIEQLQKLRDAFGRPMVISSGKRCSAHNSVIGGAVSSMHLLGNAVDVVVPSDQRYELVRTAMSLGWKGIGVAKGFIHLDLRSSSPMIWQY